MTPKQFLCHTKGRTIVSRAFYYTQNYRQEGFPKGTWNPIHLEVSGLCEPCTRQCIRAKTVEFYVKVNSLSNLELMSVNLASVHQPCTYVHQPCTYVHQTCTYVHQPCTYVHLSSIRSLIALSGISTSKVTYICF